MDSHILIIDDNIESSKILDDYLTLEGYKITIESDGKDGLKRALNQSFDAIILDIILPTLNGFEVIKSIREFNDTPIIILTARTDNVDRLVSLEIGADDYLDKPCNPNELIARLRAISRRTQKTSTNKPIIKHNDIVVDCSKRIATLLDNKLELTNTEFNILEILIKSPGQAFSKEELTEYALGRKYTAYDRSIDVHISNLRSKLGDNPQGEAILKTVRGFGYLLDINSNK